MNVTSNYSKRGSASQALQRLSSQQNTSYRCRAAIHDRLEDTAREPRGMCVSHKKLGVRLFRCDRRKELVCRLNLWRMELFKYMKACHGVAGSNGVRSTLSPPRCRH